MAAVNLKVIDFKELKNSEEKFNVDTNDISEDIIAYTLGWQRARRRSGSAKIKQMWEISGTTAKPHKQKGTGMARAGSRRTTQFVGGRTCFGPIPRSFDYSLPKKIAKRAVSDTLKAKFAQKEVVLAQNIVGTKIKTSYINKALVSNKINSALFLYNGEDKTSQDLVKSVRNIKNVKALDVKAINAYDLLRYNILVLDKSLLENIKKIIG
jgi:large subunit ribosomal protein L4